MKVVVAAAITYREKEVVETSLVTGYFGYDSRQERIKNKNITINSINAELKKISNPCMITVSVTFISDTRVKMKGFTFNV